jgi:hypothetical protein
MLILGADLGVAGTRQKLADIGREVVIFLW